MPPCLCGTEAIVTLKCTAENAPEEREHHFCKAHGLLALTLQASAPILPYCFGCCLSSQEQREKTLQDAMNNLDQVKRRREFVLEEMASLDRNMLRLEEIIRLIHQCEEGPSLHTMLQTLLNDIGDKKHGVEACARQASSLSAAMLRRRDNGDLQELRDCIPLISAILKCCTALASSDSLPFSLLAPLFTSLTVLVPLLTTELTGDPINHCLSILPPLLETFSGSTKWISNQLHQYFLIELLNLLTTFIRTTNIQVTNEAAVQIMQSVLKLLVDAVEQPGEVSSHDDCDISLRGIIERLSVLLSSIAHDASLRTSMVSKHALGTLLDVLISNSEITTSAAHTALGASLHYLSHLEPVRILFMEEEGELLCKLWIGLENSTKGKRRLLLGLLWNLSFSASLRPIIAVNLSYVLTIISELEVGVASYAIGLLNNISTDAPVEVANEIVEHIEPLFNIALKTPQNTSSVNNLFVMTWNLAVHPETSVKLAKTLTQIDLSSFALTPLAPHHEAFFGMLTVLGATGALKETPKTHRLLRVTVDFIRSVDTDSPALTHALGFIHSGLGHTETEADWREELVDVTQFLIDLILRNSEEVELSPAAEALLILPHLALSADPRLFTDIITEEVTKNPRILKSFILTLSTLTMQPNIPSHILGAVGAQANYLLTCWRNGLGLEPLTFEHLFNILSSVPSASHMSPTLGVDLTQRFPFLPSKVRAALLSWLMECVRVDPSLATSRYLEVPIRALDDNDEPVCYRGLCTLLLFLKHLPEDFDLSSSSLAQTIQPLIELVACDRIPVRRHAGLCIAELARLGFDDDFRCFLDDF